MRRQPREPKQARGQCELHRVSPRLVATVQPELQGHSQCCIPEGLIGPLEWRNGFLKLKTH